MALTEAQTLIAITNEEFYIAEIARLEGELRLQVESQAPHIGPDTSSSAAAERCFEQALSAPPQAWRGCGGVRADMPKHTTCWRRSTTGLPRVLIRLICRTPEHC
jgi:hypothetical protein